MDWQSRLIAPCARFDLGSRDVKPDIPALFRRLLLFETFILQTSRFQEFPTLVQKLGVGTVVRLLDSGALKLELEPNQLCQVGQSGPPVRDKPPLALGSYSFSVILFSQYDEYLVRCIQDVRRSLYGFLSQADLMKLETAIFRALLPRRETPEPPKIPALNDLLKELHADSRVIRRSLIMKLQRDNDCDIPEEDLRFKVHSLDKADFAIETNLAEFGLTKEEVHKTVESAIFAVGNLSMRLEESRNCNALSGAVDRELSLFAEKFDHLSETLSCSYREMKSALPPEERESTLTRILQIRRLPTFELSPPGRSFDIDRFLEVRSSDEAVQFRAALRRMQYATDEEIAERVNSFRLRFGSLVESSSGKVIRIALSSLASFCGDMMLAPAGTVTGVTISLIESFLLKTVFPADGMSLFLSGKYRSLFDPPSQPQTSPSGQRVSPSRLSFGPGKHKSGSKRRAR